MSEHHVPLEAAFTGPEAKRRYVRRQFATIASRYNHITVLHSFGRERHWKTRLVSMLELPAGSQVLDLACGTGDIAFEAARRHMHVIGVDITLGMLELARKKPQATGVRFVAGEMCGLPIAAGSVDAVTTGYGLRNVPDLPHALAEIHRALRPGGLMASLDFDRPSARWLRAIYLGYLTAVGSGLGWALHRDPDTYRYIPASIRRYPGARGVCALMQAAGFVDVRHVPVFGGLMAIHIGRKPRAS
jgi:demethylmenaquinone methyltransferase/2-methoxy-6-polyprenyl-1,4-benzoquinol methylase